MRRTLLITGSEDNTVKLWDASTGQELCMLKGHTRGVSSVAFSPDGSSLISGSNDTTVKLWDAGTEVNQEPVVGSDQAARQAAPNTGAAENGVVQAIYSVTDGFTYPGVESSLKFTISNDAGMMMNMMAPDSG